MVGTDGNGELKVMKERGRVAVIVGRTGVIVAGIVLIVLIFKPQIIAMFAGWFDRG